MDHEMRLRQVFTLAGLKPKAIDQHLERLRKQRAEVDAVDATTMQAEVVYNAKRRGRPLHVQILYGDITSRSMLSSPAVGAVRRAVVSPEDTCISAGGGVAYKLLHKAGDYILNDLAKLQPIEHTSVATTAGGDLPVHYIFHAAALRIDESGNYIVNQANVSATVTAVLQLSQALAIGALWIPLIGAGTAGLEAATSLRSILECVREWRPPHPATVHIVIYSDSILTRTIAQRLARQVLGKMYTAV
jgi:O-acetyl-ADP-ribose deacetylase (regulator of RNase III)